MRKGSARLGLASALIAGIGGFGAFAGGVGASAADGFSMDYVLGGGDGAVTCPAAASVGVNGVCDSNAGAGTFDLSIADASGQKVSGVISFKDASAAVVQVDPIPFCNEIHGVVMPPSAAQIFVRIGVVGRTGGNPTGVDPTGLLPSGQPKANLPCGAPTAPTKGTVTITGSAVSGGSMAASRASFSSHGKTASAAAPSAAATAGARQSGRFIAL